MAAAESLRELGRLAETAGASVVGQALQRRAHPDPATFVGSGKLREIQAARAETGYSVVLFDEQLAPAQQLRLESALDVKVLDRSALILDIFASRARTREAALQVELAQHEYLLPRLRGQWQHLERMEGAIGSRGPGETQLETDRRLIGQRIARLKRDIEQVRRQRALHRRRRTQQGIPVVALVGYTNAGKSSLLRALAGAEAYAADELFATLDPLTRRVVLPGGEAFLLTDTVGFIQKLPAQLISAFRATLEELATADLLLHVVDATSPALAAQVATVLATLAGLGLAERRVVAVLNKGDGCVLPDGTPVASEADLPRVDVQVPEAARGALLVSALHGWGLDALRRRLTFELGSSATAGAAAP
ncbi:MAG: GTPase HflX [Chloroflexi bacterium]|nr:GTPase HflX [Chloroflexota bacterium]